MARPAALALSFGAAALLLPGMTPSPAQADGEVLKSLQGTWKGARYSEGKGDDPSKGVPLEFTFKGTGLAGRREATQPIGEGTFVLSKDGTCIDVTGSTGSYKGKAYPGILKIEGDTLSWCTGTPRKEPKRPGGFVADPKEGHYLIVVKRQTP